MTALSINYSEAITQWQPNLWLLWTVQVQSRFAATQFAATRSPKPDSPKP